MTRKSLTARQNHLLQGLRIQSMLTLQFIEAAHEFPSGERFRKAVEDDVENGDLRMLRLLSREIDAITLALPPNEREGLEAILRNRLGVDKDAQRAELRHRIAGIIVRGTIASEKERRHLEDYLEMLEATGGDPSEIAAVRRLIGSS
jgi:hypothetical protein